MKSSGNLEEGVFKLHKEISLWDEKQLIIQIPEGSSALASHHSVLAKIHQTARTIANQQVSRVCLC